MSPKTYAAVTATVFLVIAAAHLVRLFTEIEVRIGDWSAPTWVSIIGLAVAGYLSYAGFRLATRR